MTEQDAQMLVLDAQNEILRKHSRYLHRVNMTFYGYYGELLDLLREGKVAEVITKLETARDHVKQKIINR